MATATLDSGKAFTDKAADAVRVAAHVSHEARLLKSLASDAVDDGIHAARRAATVARRDLETMKEEAVYRIKRNPVVAVAVSFGVGIGLGVAIAAASRACARANVGRAGDPR